MFVPECTCARAQVASGLARLCGASTYMYMWRLTWQGPSFLRLGSTPSRGRGAPVRKGNACRAPMKPPWPFCEFGAPTSPSAVGLDNFRVLAHNNNLLLRTHHQATSSICPLLLQYGACQASPRQARILVRVLQQTDCDLGRNQWRRWTGERSEWASRGCSCFRG